MPQTKTTPPQLPRSRGTISSVMRSIVNRESPNVFWSEVLTALTVMGIITFLLLI
jgi:hypothetical protein